LQPSLIVRFFCFAFVVAAHWFLPLQLVEKGKVCLSDAIMPWEGFLKITQVHFYCDLISVAPGYGSFINVNVWRAKAGEPCINSDILDGFAHYTLNKLG